MILTTLIGLGLFISVYGMFTVIGEDLYKPSRVVSAKELSDYVSSTIRFVLSSMNANDRYLGKHYSNANPVLAPKIAFYCYTSDCSTLKSRFDDEDLNYTCFNGFGVDSAENRPVLTPLINDLSGYDVVVLEDPYISLTTLTTDSKVISDELDNFLSGGGSLIASGHGDYIEKFGFSYTDGGSNTGDLECTVELREKNMALFPGVIVIPSTIPFVSSTATIASYNSFSGDCVSGVEHAGGGKVYYFSDFVTKNNVDLEGSAALLLKSWHPPLQGNVPNMVVFLHPPYKIMDSQYVVEGSCDDSGTSWIVIRDARENVLSRTRTSVNCVDSFLSGKVFASEDTGIGFYRSGNYLYVEVANYERE